MHYKIYGPYEIPRLEGEFKRRIDKEDVAAFWDIVDGSLYDGCGCYVFCIATQRREKPWYVGKAQKQSFGRECFTPHKIVMYHEALEKSNGTPLMYFLARFTKTGHISRPTRSAAGHADIDFVERMFIEKGFHVNRHIRNKRDTKNPENLIVEGFYNSRDRRRNPVKRLYELFGGE
ncbi:MAG: hypothetical protein OYH76_15385 [Defluviicoccus sp.]|nr:hypothetical protein [Defluviicoccus sp.]MDE0277276.1 hypothetical protein [Defluviicoccus sp.]